MKKLLLLVAMLVASISTFAQCNINEVDYDGRYFKVYDSMHSMISRSDEGKDVEFWDYTDCYIVIIKKYTYKTYQVYVYNNEFNRTSIGYHDGEISDLRVNSSTITITNTDRKKYYYDKNLNRK